MRILAILPLVPYPPDRGDRLRAWEMLHGLAGAGEVKTAIIAVESLREPAGAALQGVAGCISYQQLDRTALSRGALRAALNGTPPAIGSFWHPFVERRLVAECPGPWDLVVAFQLRSAPYALKIRGTMHALELTDSLSLYRQRLPRWGRTAIKRWGLRGVDALEGRVPPEFDVYWVSATEDAEAIEALAGVRPRVVPNGCTPVVEPAPYAPDGPLLFLGDMRYPPNEDGIVWFMRVVWPGLRERWGALTLHIVGRTTPQVEREANAAGVVVVGPLEDPTPEIEAAMAIINPVRYGSGSSRKVLAGWATARPIISSTAGIRGLVCEPGRDVLLADTSPEWIQQVEWLRGTRANGERLGRRGWVLARGVYDAATIWRRALSEIFPAHTAMSGS